MAELNTRSGGTSIAHKLLNKLSVVIGNCDLVREISEQQGPKQPCKRRLVAILEAAQEMAEEVKRHRIELDAITIEIVVEPEKNPPTKIMLCAVDDHGNPLKANCLCDQGLIRGHL